jgi:integrase
MAVRRIRKSWWIDFTFNYRRYRKRSPENSRLGALAYERVIRQRLARGDPATDTRQTLAAFAERWLRDYVAPNNKPSERISKTWILRGSLIPFFGSKPVGEITVEDIERYKAALVRSGLSRKTVNNRLTVLRKCLHSAYEWLKLSGAPPKIQWLKCPPPRTDYLGPDECALLLREAKGPTRELILAALRTGMRLGELKGLQWDSIDWLNRIVVVRHSYNERVKELGSPKSNRERHIPLDIDLYEVLAARRRSSGYVFLSAGGTPFTNDQLGPALAAVCRRAGLRKVGWHTLRHTFATHLAMRGTPLHVVQRLLGHASIEVTMRYAHVAPSALRTAIDLANPRTAYPAEAGQPAVNAWRGLRTQQPPANGL